MKGTEVIIERVRQREREMKVTEVTIERGKKRVRERVRERER